MLRPQKQPYTGLSYHCQKTSEKRRIMEFVRKIMVFPCFAMFFQIFSHFFLTNPIFCGICVVTDTTQMSNYKHTEV